MNSTAGEDYRICVNCVMDSTDSHISFDSEGICDHCSTFRQAISPNWSTDDKSQRELEKIFARVQEDGKKREFDCIIGMSGGADSSYLLHVAVTRYGLRPLVFHVDAGWNSQIAVNNIEKLVEGLGLDLFTEVINWEEMRDLQLAFFKAGVPHVDTPQDHAFFATMYKFASEHRVKYILTGANFSTECVRNPIEWMYYQSDSTQLRDIHRRYGKAPLRTFPITNIAWHKIYLPYVRGIRVLRPLNYFPYIKSEAMQELSAKYGWLPYPQKHFESRFTRFYESYWLPERFGYDTRRVQFSSLILTGQMTREDALEELRKPAYDSDTIGADIEFVASKLEIEVAELMGYLRAPKRTYKDFKNQMWLYSLGARFMRLFGLERGGKR